MVKRHLVPLEYEVELERLSDGSSLEKQGALLLTFDASTIALTRTVWTREAGALKLQAVGLGLVKEHVKKVPYTL